MLFDDSLFKCDACGNRLFEKKSYATYEGNCISMLKEKTPYEILVCTKCNKMHGDINDILTLKRVMSS